MATREAPRRSTRAKQFAFKYFEQVHNRVKELERKRDAAQPKRQPLIYRGEASGASQAAHITQTEIQAADALQYAANIIDDAADIIDDAAEVPPVQAVANELQNIAHKIDSVADQKISHVQNRLSFSVFREAVGDMFQQLPQLNVRQRVMAVYHMGANFFLREERSQGQGVQGTIQSWPDQYFDETPELRDAMEAEGGLDNILGSSVD